MTNEFSNPDDMAPPLGNYTHGAALPPDARILYTAGQVGVGLDNEIPADFRTQAENVWKNLTTILEHNGMTMADVVKINHFITSAENLPAYREVLAKYVAEARPPATMLVVAGLARPALLLEVELVAAA